MNAQSGQMTDNGSYPERAAAQRAAQQTLWYSCAKRIERALVELPQEVTPRAEATGCGDVNSFGGAVLVTGILVENKKLSRPDNADDALRTGAGVDRLYSDVLVLRTVSAARTTTRVDLKLGADVDRLRRNVFVLRVLRCLTFEVSWRRRRDALDSKRKMGRRPSA